MAYFLSASFISDIAKKVRNSVIAAMKVSDIGEFTSPGSICIMANHANPANIYNSSKKVAIFFIF